jgi:hypothetical protein
VPSRITNGGAPATPTFNCFAKAGAAVELRKRTVAAKQALI